MSVLLLAENIARSADFKVLHRNLEAASKLRELPYRRQPLLRLLAQHSVTLVEKKRVGGTVRTADTASELV